MSLKITIIDNKDGRVLFEDEEALGFMGMIAQKEKAAGICLVRCGGYHLYKMVEGCQTLVAQQTERFPELGAIAKIEALKKELEGLMSDKPEENTHMRKWYKCVPPKYIQKNIVEVYRGIWMPQMDKYWESDDGYSVMSRQIRTDWGKVEHITIQRMGAMKGGDVPWMVKQEIKNELFGEDRIAIEVFPTEKNLVDMCDVYHLWLLPKEMKLPFGIHPTRDPNCKPVERGMDFNMETVKAWMDSTERKVIMGEQDGNEGTG